jgi:carbon storage regulator
MLVIPRKKNEQIVLYDNIFVTVIEIRGDKVRLGIEHPKEVPVHRKEVHDAIYRAMSETAPATLTAPERVIAPPAPVVIAAPPKADKVTQLAAALQSRLGVAVSRELVIQVMRETGIDV